MTYQVNLNHQSLLPGFGPVQLPAFVLTALLAFTVASAWVFLAWSEHQSLLEQEAELQQVLITEKQRLAEFQSQNPTLTNEPELLAANESLTSRLQRARETYSGLANQLENAVDGFHQSLVQLSDYDLNGLWLSQIRLQDGKRRFLLEGYAHNPELIPQYIEQLGASSFKGISIEYFRLQKQDDADLWRFSLSNSPLTDTAKER